MAYKWPKCVTWPANTPKISQYKQTRAKRLRGSWSQDEPGHAKTKFLRVGAATTTTLLTPIAQLSFSYGAQQLRQRCCCCACNVYERCVAAPLLHGQKALAVSQLVIQSSRIGAERPELNDALHLLPVGARYWIYYATRTAAELPFICLVLITGNAPLIRGRDVRTQRAKMPNNRFQRATLLPKGNKQELWVTAPSATDHLTKQDFQECVKAASSR